MCAGAPPSWCFRRALDARTISTSLCVRSSSDLPPLPPSMLTDGRTASGGMGSTLTMNHSGRDHLGSRPSAMQSSSEIAIKMSRARAGEMVCLRAPEEPVSSSLLACGFHSATSFWSTNLSDGWLAPHPPPVAVASSPSSKLHFCAVRHRSDVYLSRISGLFSFLACANFAVVREHFRREHEKHTERSTRSVVFISPGWKTGCASSRCPKWPAHSF
mmetsp:Transcript_17047/g.43559  ORF Transcript_17047/g.43559 Transcript_17047/m.43559 type:complete len:216 (-) Transcript_17047:406-1053(-)